LWSGWGAGVLLAPRAPQAAGAGMVSASDTTQKSPSSRMDRSIS
jgi:hypothetical protein